MAVIRGNAASVLHTVALAAPDNMPGDGSFPPPVPAASNTPPQSEAHELLLPPQQQSATHEPAVEMRTALPPPLPVNPELMPTAVFESQTMPTPPPSPSSPPPPPPPTLPPPRLPSALMGSTLSAIPHDPSTPSAQDTPRSLSIEMRRRPSSGPLSPDGDGQGISQPSQPPPAPPSHEGTPTGRPRLPSAQWAYRRV